MRYPCVIEPGDETHAFGVIFPDCPGCYSGGDTLEEALNNAPEALAGWMEDMIDEGFPINPPSSFDEVAKNPEYKSWIFAMVDVDLDKLSDKTEELIFVFHLVFFGDWIIWPGRITRIDQVTLRALL